MDYYNRHVFNAPRRAAHKLLEIHGLNALNKCAMVRLGCIAHSESLNGTPWLEGWVGVGMEREVCI